jgi:hypothetical protein
LILSRDDFAGGAFRPENLLTRVRGLLFRRGRRRRSGEETRKIISFDHEEAKKELTMEEKSRREKAKLSIINNRN